MATLTCPRCGTLAPGADYHGCDTCGTLFCEPCGAAIGGRCPDCCGTLHPNLTFPPKGKYRLFYPPLVRLSTAEERVAWVNRRWDAGIMSKFEREILLAIIAKQADGEEARA